MIKLLSRIAGWFAENPEPTYDNKTCDHEYSESPELTNEFAWHDSRIEDGAVVVPQYEKVEEYCENCGRKRGPMEQRQGWAVESEHYREGVELHLPIDKAVALTESANRAIAPETTTPPSSGSEVEVTTDEHTYELTD